MSILQVIGVGVLVALLGCCCDASNDVKFTLLGPKMESLETAVAAADGRSIPYVGINFLPLIRETLKTEPLWYQKLTQAIANKTRLQIAANDLQNIEDEFLEIIAKIKEIKVYSYNDKKSKTLTAEIESILMRMIGRVFKGDSLFRLYPSLSLPALVDFTSFTVAIKSKLQKYVPNSKVFCKLLQTFDIYLEPTYLERFRKIEHHVAQETDKGKRGFSHLIDNFSKNNVNIDEESYIGCGYITCGYDYFARIRIKMDEFFKKASSPIDTLCMRHNIYAQMQEKTGYGWVRIDIGAVLAVGIHSEICDNWGLGDRQYCDPYVKIFINDKEVYTTKKMLNAIGWQSFNEVFHSSRIPHNSTIKLKLFDDDNKENYGDPLLLEKEIIIGTENVNPLHDGRSQIFVNTFWRQEFKNEI